MIRLLLAALVVATPVTAQDRSDAPQTTAGPSEAGQPPQRIRAVQLQAGQPCPRSTADEIVVCETLTEPYRIPRQLRNEGPIPAENQSWVNRAATMDQTSRVAAGLPDTCSPVGYGGQSGCALQANRAWAAEKRAQARAAESVPGGQ